MASAAPRSANLDSGTAVKDVYCDENIYMHAIQTDENASTWVNYVLVQRIQLFWNAVNRESGQFIWIEGITWFKRKQFKYLLNLY